MLRPIVRVSSFLSKEIREIVRQPWLVVRLILGPFLILLLVGLGFTNQPRVLRAMFVVPPDEPQVASQVEAYATSLGPQLKYAGQTVNKEDALAQLRRGQVDLVVVYPAHAYETVRNGSQAVLQIYHNEIDPAQAAYVSQFGHTYVDEMNRRILQSFASQAQEESKTAAANLQGARATTSGAPNAGGTGNNAGAGVGQNGAGTQADSATALLGAAGMIMRSLEQGLGAAPAQAAGQGPAAVTDTQKLDSNLSNLDEQLTAFDSIPAGVLVAPLRTDVKSVAAYTPSFVTFYAPAVLALILQHVAISIAALALVREKFSGAIELFRVAPVTAFEILLGKYGSYLLFVGFLSVVLAAAMIYLLGVPLLGQVAWLVLSIGLLVFASLGIGFAISATSGTDSQAVQFSMLVLLASIFFSGFVFPLMSILVPIRYLGYLLPVTYSITNLQNVMLKGIPPPSIYLVALGVMGVVLFAFSWWRYRRSVIRP